MTAEANEPIRITRDEALGRHADELLQRQKAMRGQGGLRRLGRHAWYLQNWFLFLCAGLACSLLAWGIIEPNFHDYPYIIACVREVVPADEALESLDLDRAALSKKGGTVTGAIMTDQAMVLILAQTRLATPSVDGSAGMVDLTAISPGQELGLHVTSLGQVLHRGKPTILAYAMALDPAVSGHPQPPSLDSQNRRQVIFSLLFFSIVAGLVGLGIGVADAAICRLWRRAVLCGSVGLVVGVIGGLISGVIASIVYAPISEWALGHQDATGGGLSHWGFMLQMGGRSLAWGIAGVAMGLGQGLALRSWRLLVYGLIGGLAGGLLGGLLFDPIDFLITADPLSADWSRCVGIGVVGASVGLMIGVVELLARDAWLRMTQGPLRGKEFLLFKDSMRLGSSSRSDIYLFNDPAVEEHHADLRQAGEDYELENHGRTQPVQVNGREITRVRLHHGDRISIGSAEFVFEKRGG